MNGKDLFLGLSYIDRKYIEEAERDTVSDRMRTSATPLRRPLLVAAIIALTLLLVGCAVVYALRLQDMKFGEYTSVTPSHYGPGWVVIGAEEKTYELISLQGSSDSPNHLAVKEWREYLDASGDTAMIQEKEAALDAILEKYHLQPLGEEISVCLGRSHILLDALGLTGICVEQDYARTEYTSGRFYPEGTFELGVDIFLDENTFDWPYSIHADFQYYKKGFFKYYYISVQDLDSFQEWEYTLPGGGRALLGLGSEDALILVETEDAYLSVHFDSRRGVDHMTQEMVERIADLFDFSISPRSLRGGEVWQVQTELQMLDDQELLETRERAAQYEQSLKKDGFAGWVRETLENCTPETAKALGYAFWDIDGNGIDDLLIGRDGYCTAIYWEVDGQTQQFANAASVLYPCEDQVIGYVLIPGGTNYFFTQASNGTTMGVANINYVPGHPEGEYQKYSMTQWNQYENISKEEFDSIFSSYVRVPLTFLPLTEYPLEQEVNPMPSETGLYTEDYESYAEKIRIRLTSKEEQWSRWAYDIRDLNGDGIDEMVWQEDDRFFLYTIQEGKVSGYSMVYDGSITVCENGYVEAVYHYGPTNKTYRYYRLEQDRAVLVEYLRYDADTEHPWTRSPDLSCQDTTLEAISETEFESIRAKYVPLELEMKPISDFSLD